MTKSILLRGAVLFLAAVSPAILCAQFQPPNPDELKMISDPEAPGAAGVYLQVREIENDPLHYESFYKRIKVLTEKGKELATVELPYLQGNWTITEIKGRTIHSDGTIIPLTVKPEDLLITKSGDWEANKKVFTLPGVEVGSVLEYYYEIHYNANWFSSPQWTVQQSYFVHKAHYEFTAETDIELADEHERVAQAPALVAAPSCRSRGADRRRRQTHPGHDGHFRQPGRGIHAAHPEPALQSRFLL